MSAHMSTCMSAHMSTRMSAHIRVHTHHAVSTSSSRLWPSARRRCRLGILVIAHRTFQLLQSVLQLLRLTIYCSQHRSYCCQHLCCHCLRLNLWLLCQYIHISHLCIYIYTHAYTHACTHVCIRGYELMPLHMPIDMFIHDDTHVYTQALRPELKRRAARVLNAKVGRHV